MKRIAWFSPVDPLGETISGAFSLNILPKLQKYFDITVFVDRFEENTISSNNHYLQAAKLHRDNPFDLFVYQLENDPRLNFSRIHCGLIPGLTIFHHYNFINFGPEPILNSPWQKVVSRFLSKSEGWPERGAKFFQSGPQGIRESAWALQALFTNPINISDFNNSSEVKISSKYGLAPLHLPFPAVSAAAKTKNTEFTLAYAGRPLIQDRTHKIFKALGGLKDIKLLWMISKEDESSAKELLEEFSVKATLIDGRNAANWSQVVSNADIALHTQFTVFDQLSPYLQQSMISGKPVIVNDFGFADSLPDDLVFKLSVGQNEVAELRMLIMKLAGSDLSVLSKKISEYAERSFQSDSVAFDLFELITNNMPAYKAFYDDWREFSLLAKASLIKEADTDFERNLDLFSSGLNTNDILGESRKEFGI